MDDLSLHTVEDISSSQLATARTPYSTPVLRPRALSFSSGRGREAESSSLVGATGHSITPELNSREFDIIRNFFERLAKNSGKHRIVISAEDDEEDDDVTEAFIVNYNKNYGNGKNDVKVEKLLDKMERLGGLKPAKPGDKPDLLVARRGLCLLTGLDKPEYKLRALESLILLLKNDPLTPDSAVHLGRVTIKLMQTMDEELFQTENMMTQAKIAEAYSLSVELIQRQYARSNLNAIHEDLKSQLIKSAKALKDLNMQDDPRVSFHAQAALEGIRRIVDDKKELYDVAERFFRATIAVLSLMEIKYGGNFAVEQLELAFSDLDPHIKSSWYNGMLIFKELGKEAMTDVKKLYILQKMVGGKYNQYSWKYTYAAMDVLTNIAIHSTNEQIRHQAFQGIKQFGTDFPGVISFSGCNELTPHRDMKQLTHFKMPPMKDTNLQVRRACVENLVKIARESPDEAIRVKARQVLAARRQMEKDPGLFAKLERIVPSDPAARQKWVKEGSNG